MKKYTNIITSKSGDALPGVTVKVLNQDGTTATIYSDNGTTQIPGGVVTTDGGGIFSFYATNGRYNLQISGQGINTYTLQDELLYDPHDDESSLAGKANAVDLASTAIGKGMDLIGDSIRASILADTANGHGADLIANAAKKVASIAALKALRVPQGSDAQTVIVDCYATTGDQGGGLFYWNPTSTAADDGGITINPTGNNGNGRWVRHIMGQPVNVRWYGAKGDGATDDTAAINAAISYANANDAVLLIPNATSSYKITSNIALPRRVTCQGKFSGGMTLTLTTTKNAIIDGLVADNVTLSGVWYSKLTNWKLTGNLLINGYSPVWGTFWNYFDNIVCNKLTLDVTLFAINQNHFKGINPTTSTDYGIRLTASSGTYECHGNLFEACDVSRSLGILNDAPNQQTNYLRQFYCEGGALIKGSFNIGVSGGVYDAQAPANVGMFNHILGMVDHIQRTNADSISMGRDNLIDGGNWDHLNSGGSPVGISTFGITGAVVTDATDPSGIGKKYGGNATGTFQGISVTLRPTPNQRASLVGFWYGDLPEAVSTVASGLTETYYTPGSVFTQIGTSSWYIFRLSPICGNNVNTTLKFYINAGTANNKNSFISGIFASPWKAAMFPYLGRDVVNNNGAITIFGKTRLTGQYGVPYIAASPTTYTVNFPQAFGSGVTPTVNITPVPSSGYAGKLTGCEVTAVTNTGFTVVLKYSVDWTGALHWSAEA